MRRWLTVKKVAAMAFKTRAVENSKAMSLAKIAAGKLTMQKDFDGPLNGCRKMDWNEEKLWNDGRRHMNNNMMIELSI